MNFTAYKMITKGIRLKSFNTQILGLLPFSAGTSFGSFQQPEYVYYRPKQNMCIFFYLRVTPANSPANRLVR